MREQAADAPFEVVLADDRPPPPSQDANEHPHRPARGDPSPQACLDLTHALAGDAEAVSEFLQRRRLRREDALPRDQEFALLHRLRDRRQPRQRLAGGPAIAREVRQIDATEFMPQAQRLDQPAGIEAQRVREGAGALDVARRGEQPFERRDRPRPTPAARDIAVRGLLLAPDRGVLVLGPPPALRHSAPYSAPSEAAPTGEASTASSLPRSSPSRSTGREPPPPSEGPTMPRCSSSSMTRAARG